MLKQIFVAAFGLTILCSLTYAQAGMDPQEMNEMNKRGDKHMGFDQAKTTHHFLLAKDGGTIQVEANDAKDTESREQIRKHLQHIAVMFREGNFKVPMLVHEQTPPGSEVMSRLKIKIGYQFEQSDKGAKIVISTNDAEALKAIHEFLKFQIKEHKTGDSLEIGFINAQSRSDLEIAESRAKAKPGTL